MGSALNRDCVMPPHSIRFELSLLSLQLALSPMRVFAIRIERSFDLSIQCSHAIVCLDRDEKFAGPVYVPMDANDDFGKPSRRLRVQRARGIPHALFGQTR
jgi:hypothetical protein